MNKQLQILRKVSLTIIAAGASLLSYGQKLKTVQEGSVYAPANVKVDAKMTEWAGYQAYNKTTDVFYTLSNDDKNLYLAVKSTSQQNNNKIMAGGINLTINTADKKKDKDAFILTFPLITRAGRGDRGQRGAGGGAPGGGRGGFGGGAPGGGRQQLDSAALATMRRTALAAIKEIKVFGFKDIQDSVISIYNEYGIKAAADYDDKGAFVYELSVPLKLLNLDVATAKEFAYNIKVNGLTMNRGDAIEVRGEGGGGNAGGGFGGGGGGRGGGGGGGGRGGGGGGAGGGGGGAGGGRANGGGGAFNMQDMTTPTDFWGKYILAKK